MVRVIMHGCNGRMGQVITEMIAKEAEMEIVAGVDLSDHIQNSYPVFKCKSSGRAAGCLCRKKSSLCALHHRTFGRTACTCQRGFR